jgi:hypothetical protein
MASSSSRDSARIAISIEQGFRECLKRLVDSDLHSFLRSVARLRSLLTAWLKFGCLFNRDYAYKCAAPFPNKEMRTNSTENNIQKLLLRSFILSHQALSKSVAHQDLSASYLRQ